MNFILRLDDICPTMDWDKFRRLEVLLSRYEKIKPLIGVIPCNRDANLQFHPPRVDFWDQVRHWRKMGWTIAQHGYTHEYTQNDGGTLGIGRQSEFAGLDYEDQYSKLSSGKAILLAEGVWEPYFMAPSHAFDNTTLVALADLGFTAITDGYGIFPYRMGPIVAVPQLFSRAIHLGLGTYTLCLHANTMDTKQFAHLEIALAKYHQNFISFQAATQRPNNGILASNIRRATAIALRVARSFKRG